jgi:uncharacterized membrane-anchored protein
MNAIRLPPELAERERLASELHARPYESVATPGALLSVATLRSGPEQDAVCLAHLARLDPQAVAGLSGATHLRLQWQNIRIKWERHTEFYSFTLFADWGPADLAHCFDSAWLEALPAGWLAQLPGQMIAATQIALLPCPGEPPHVRSVAPVFGSELVVGNRIAEGAATVVTDLRSVQGVTRFLVFDHSAACGPHGAAPDRDRHLPDDGALEPASGVATHEPARCRRGAACLVDGALSHIGRWR